ncbi:protein ELYS isoform X2 [Sphaerodactylus townsendi]|uniref:protein ELYS isoform X2 n=1 Tax=Sphaerodactylus townsendi TaxID=933632 RepID=UPI002027412C|nr:protein ELYS isoform X2 [Sphaerodactylus townsendi]
MRDLTAHVTSSLLQFPEVTTQALGEDEITLDSVLNGTFTGGRSGLACLSCGPQLEVVNPITGERLSAYRFNGVNEQPPTILAVKEFSWQKRTGLLIGLEETEGSVLCLYDLGISRVVKAVVLPGRVTAIEPIINHGGASLTTQHLHQSLRWLFGVAAVVTDVGHVLLIDLCLDDQSCSQNEVEASDLEVITGIPPEIPQIREAITRKGRHLCFQLLSPSGAAVKTLSYIHRINQLVVGFSDGYLSLWNMKTLKKEYHSQLEGGRIPVYAVTFQEPENDPRNCCYLWASQSTQESEGDVVSLHLLQLAFSDRRRLASGQIMYEGLEYCEERYSLDLTGGVFSLRGQTSNTKLIGCQTIEKFRSHVDREDGINEVISPDTSVSVFTWQVNTYGQGKPSAYLGIFDINRWYHAQMPDSLRPGEFLHNCPYFALWSLDAVVSMTNPHRILDVLVHERSLSRGAPPSYPPPEQFFNPSTYNFDATCLLNCGIVHVTCTGFQKDTLHFLKQSGGSLNEAIPDSYNRCLIAGLLSPRFVDVQPSSLSQEEQLEAVLSAAVQTSSLGLLTNCIKQWTTEEQPNSAPNLRFVLEWTWNKVITTKQEFVRLCVPLFDRSSNFIDPQTLQSLQRCELLLSNLNTVLNCFVTEAQELTEKGITDLTNKQTVTGLLLQYVQVVIWFCRSSLLPEGIDEDMQLSKPFYNYENIQRFYVSSRQKLERSSRGKWNSDCLMIDGMISQLGDTVVKLWQRDGGGTEKYPPPTLHALLDLYLLENIEELYKHAITIYLLLDIMHTCPNKTDTTMDSFPTAFAIPIGLVNLIQGYWCLDHSDYENSLSYLFHPATIKLPWQHMRIIQVFMCQGEHRRALRYIQMMKPSMTSSSEVALHLTVLLFNSCMVEAWSVLRQHSTRLNVEGMLKHVYEICQELGLMEDLLKLPFTVTEQECLEKFLQTSADVHNHEFLLVHHLQRANYVPALQLNQSLKMNLLNDRDPRWRERSVARNSILEQYGKVLPRVQRKLAVERAKPYHLSSSLRLEVLRPRPLSTIAKHVTTGNVVTKATFISNVLSKIGEVWMGAEQKNKSFQNDITEEQTSGLDCCADTELPDPFVGTPVIKSLRKCSRLLDLVVRPVGLFSPVLGSNCQVSPRASSMLSSPLYSYPRCSMLQHKNLKNAPELKLLETPAVVKRAKALTSTSSSGFPGFTPQSILRSSLRTTPLATPTASPGRSITPPLRAKETKISFVEESKASEWTPGATYRKTRLNTVLQAECNLESQMEDVWAKTGELPSFPSYSVQEDYEEADLSTESTPGDNLDRSESFIETGYISMKVDQTTLEYHEKTSPGDTGDIVAYHCTYSSSEDILDIPKTAEREGSEKAEHECLQVKLPKSSDVQQLTGFPEKEEDGCSPLPEDGVSMTDHLDAVQDAVVSSHVPSNNSGILTVETSKISLLEDIRLFSERSSEGLASARVYAESVISIPHSENIASIYSKTEFEEREAAVFEKGGEEAIKENLVEKIPPVSVPESQEANPSRDGTPEVHISETVVETNSELCPTNTVEYQCSSDIVEQQVASELPDKDAGECGFSEELLLPQDDFTLILEGDEEAEVEETSTLHSFPLKSASPKSDQQGVNTTESNNQEPITDSIATVTSDKISQNTAKVLPYVPKPIKMVIAENLLDLIKDTRNKEFSSEVVEQSVHKSLSKKLLISPQDPLQNILETNKEMKINQVENTVASSTGTIGQAAISLNDLLPDDRPLTEMSKPDVLILPTPRRSARRGKDTSDIPENRSHSSKRKPQEQQPSHAVACPVGGTEKTEECNLEVSTNDHPIAPEFQAAITTRSGVKKSKELISALYNPSEQPTSGLKRTSKNTRSLVGDQEGNQFIIDQTIQMTVNPRSARKLKTMAFKLAENVISDQEGESQEKQQNVKPRRGRQKKHNILEVSTNTQTQSEKLQLHTPVRRGRSKTSSLLKAVCEEDTQPSEPQLPTRQERGQSASRAENVSNQLMEVTEQQTVRRKRGRPRKNPLNVSAVSELDLSLLSPPPLPPSPQLNVKTFVTSRRNTRSATLNKSTTSSLQQTAFSTPKKSARKVTSASVEKTEVESSLLKEHSRARSSGKRQSKMTAIKTKCNLSSLPRESTEGKPLPKSTDDAEELHSTDLTKLRLGGRQKTVVHHCSHVKRTRYSKKNLSLDGDEAFLFSPPLTKLTEKPKGAKAVTPVQLKDLDAELASRFVFSPPFLRSRKKQVSSISRIVEELKLPVKEEEDAISIDTLEKPKVKRGRPKRLIGKDGSWSPPPMEIKFISPFGTPVDEAKSKHKESVVKTEKAIKKTVSRKEKRLSSYPKPVVRKKML